MKEFKNLIFDLGDVIIDIDFQIIIHEFEKLAAVDFVEIISYFKQHKIFELFETGKISAGQFRNELKKFLKEGVTDEEINHAWNSIMTAFPEQKFVLLKELKSRYKTFALSNTNEIHVVTINQAVKKQFGEMDLRSFFHQTYYSNEVGFRKPEKEIYELVVMKEKLQPDETFFVDDLAENVEAAKKLGFHGYQLKERNHLHYLLSELGII